MMGQASFKLASAVALIVLLALMVVSAATVPAPQYEKCSEVRVKGVIDEVKSAADNTVHLMVKNDKGSIDVMVAPEKFLKEMEITFVKGDTIEVFGSQLMFDGNPVMLARELTCKGDVMIMRDEKGKPVWVGWMK